MDQKTDLDLIADALRVAVVQLYATDPEDVKDRFSIEELADIVEKTEPLRPRQVEDIYWHGLAALCRVSETNRKRVDRPACLCFADESGTEHSSYCPREGMDYDVDGQPHRCPGVTPCAECSGGGL